MILYSQNADDRFLRIFIYFNNCIVVTEGEGKVGGGEKKGLRCGGELVDSGEC